MKYSNIRRGGRLHNCHFVTMSRGGAIKLVLHLFSYFNIPVGDVVMRKVAMDVSLF